MENDEPNRGERRREEKEEKKHKLECSDCDKGPCLVMPRIFTECPLCHCPSTFVKQSIKGDLPPEEIERRNPALASLEYVYETPKGRFKVVCVVESCPSCGIIYTVARDKKIGMPAGNAGMGGLQLPPRRRGPGGLQLPNN